MALNFGFDVGGFLGGLGSHIAGNASRSKEYARQKEFAQNAISWRVQDAKRAGIHPLYALGAQPMQYQAMVADTSGLAQMGQSLGFKWTNSERNEFKTFELDMRKEQLKQAKLQTRLLENQLVDRDMSIANHISSKDAVASSKKKSVKVPGVKPVDVVRGFEKTDDAYRLVNAGDGRFFVMPQQDSSDWLQDLGVANIGDAVSYLARKYSPLPNNYRYWKKLSEELTTQAWKKKTLKPGVEFYDVKYDPFEGGYYFKIKRMH